MRKVCFVLALGTWEGTASKPKFLITSGMGCLCSIYSPSFSFFYLREEQSNNKKTVAILKFITMQKISKDMSKGVSLGCWWMKRILCNHLQNLLYRPIAVLQEVTDL